MLVVVTLAFFLYPFLTKSETQIEFIDTHRGLLVVGSTWNKVLLLPSQGFPTFLNLGENLEVWVLYKSGVDNCRLWLDNIPISVSSISRDNNIWKLHARIPEWMEEKMYDLRVEIRGENIGEKKGRNSVVVGKLKSIAVISDTHIDVENWRIMPFNINPKPISLEKVEKLPIVSKFLADLNEGIKRVENGVFVCRKEHSQKLKLMLSYLKENVKPDLVFITGDLVDWSGWKNWEELSDILAESGLPCCVVPGNHDWRPRIQLLSSRKFLVPFYLHLNSFDIFVLESDGIRLVGVNSGGDYELYAEKGAGLTCAQVRWIRGRLTENKPTVLLLHHPSTQDSFGVRNHGEVLFSVPSLRLIIAGHTHPPHVVRETIHSITQIIVPSTRDSEDPSRAFFYLDLHKLKE